MIPIKISNINILASEHARLLLENYKADLNVDELDRLLTPYSFNQVLVAKPAELREIIDTIRKRPYDKVFSSLLKVYKKFAKWEGGKYCAEKLLKNLGLTVCPYCNRTYIHSIDEKKARVCQIDHFFNKKDYPYLALSFYNLIPSCYACNHTKSTRSIGLSPYEITNSNIVAFSYNHTSISNIEVTLSTENEEMKTNIKELGLDSLYKNHNDYVGELIDKRRIYSDAYLKELEANFGDRVESREKLLRLIAGNYIEEEALKKRPPAKMTRDIMMQLGFIEA